MYSKNTKARYESIKNIYNLCDEWLNEILSLGNECAFTDDIVRQIKEIAGEITEEI